MTMVADDDDGSKNMNEQKSELPALMRRALSLHNFKQNKKLAKVQRKSEGIIIMTYERWNGKCSVNADKSYVKKGSEKN